MPESRYYALRIQDTIHSNRRREGLMVTMHGYVNQKNF